MNPSCFKAIYQGDEVWFILDDSSRSRCPQGTIIYTLAEAQILANRSEWTRKIVHEANKRGAQLSLPQPHNQSLH